jgi:hypothetical protein
LHSAGLTPARFASFQALLDRRDQRVEIDRLAQDTEPPRLPEISRVAGDDDDRKIARARLAGDLLVNGSTADTRQSDIQDDERGKPVVEMVERVETVSDRFDFVAGDPKRGGIEPAKVRIVFDDEDPSTVGHRKGVYRDIDGINKTSRRSSFAAGRCECY